MVKLADAPDLGSGAARRSGSSPLGGTTSPQSEPCKPLGICPRALLYRLPSRAVDPALGHGIARILAIPKFGRMPKPHRGCRQNIHPHPLFPQIFCCAKYLREPILLFSNGGAGTFSLPLNRHPYFGCARAPPAASGGWASDFVLARRYHVGTRRPLQRDEHGSSLPLLRRSSRAVDPALGHGIARILAIPKFGRMPKPHRGCRQNIHPHPLFPQIFCCAKYLREPYFFICKANFVSPWAFAQGLYSIACPLAQSILRPVTELPAHWAIRFRP